MTSDARRFRVLQRDGFRCRYCGATPAAERLEIDHIHPRSKGGADDEDNLITACRSCNSGKRARELSEAEIIALTAHFPCAICGEGERLEGLDCCKECDRYIAEGVRLSR